MPVGAVGAGEAAAGGQLPVWQMNRGGGSRRIRGDGLRLGAGNGEEEDEEEAGHGGEIFLVCVETGGRGFNMGGCVVSTSDYERGGMRIGLVPAAVDGRCRRRLMAGWSWWCICWGRNWSGAGMR